MPAIYPQNKCQGQCRPWLMKNNLCVCGSFYLVRREWQFSLRLLQGHPLSCAPMLSTNGQNPGSHWGSAAQAKLWVWLSRLMLSCCWGCEDGNGSKWCPLEATPAIWEPNPAAELLSPSPLRDLLKQPGRLTEAAEDVLGFCSCHPAQLITHVPQSPPSTDLGTAVPLHHIRLFSICCYDMLRQHWNSAQIIIKFADGNKRWPGQAVGLDNHCRSLK